MAVPADWVEHRRGDRELLGWMRPESGGFVVVDLLGREITEPVDWTTAERTLEDLGIGYLADAYELLVDGRWVPVRVVEAATDRIRVKSGYWKAIDAPTTEYTIGFPVGGSLRSVR